MPLRLSEAEMSSIVEVGGGRYVGVLSEIPQKMESIILFMSPQKKNHIGHSDFALDRRGCTRATGRIQCGLHRGRFEMTNAIGAGVTLEHASRDSFCFHIHTMD
jgi:hypothetical protein